MGSPGLAALLLPLVQLLLGLSASASIGCPYLPSWSTLCLLASHMVRCACCWVGTPGWHRLVQLPTLRLSFPATQVPELWWQPQCVLYIVLKGWIVKVLVH